MNTYFYVQQSDQWLYIKNISTYMVYSISFHIDGNHITPYYSDGSYFLPLHNLKQGKHRLTIVAAFILPGGIYPINEKHMFIIEEHLPHSSRNTTFRAGDILVASDNLGGLPPGYMGHSAIVVDPEHIVEATDEFPIVRKEKISQFISYHPIHAHFRPRYSELGARAAQYALQYVQQYNHNVTNGNPILKFSLWENQKLDDGMKFIYCSKLVWLCYYFGANYTFNNDFLWFSPEDLAHALSNDPNFEKLYTHPEFGFKVDS